MIALIYYIGIQKELKKSAQKQGREGGGSELAVGDSEHEVAGGGRQGGSGQPTAARLAAVGARDLVM